MDTTTALARQVDAVLANPTMLGNTVRQLAMQARTVGVQAPLVERALGGESRPLVETLVREAAAAKGAPFGLAAAETLRR